MGPLPRPKRKRLNRIEYSIALSISDIRIWIVTSASVLIQASMLWR
jgi:hypothetical protein